MAMAMAGGGGGWEASAPGKVILFGEHAVVHGSAALAASVDLRTTACVQLRGRTSEGAERRDECVSLDIASLGVHCQWPLSELHTALREEGETSLIGSAHGVRPCSDKLLTALRSLAECQLASSCMPSLGAGVTAFLFLYSRLLTNSPANVTVTTELPVGAGLGSSAAFCVAISAALLAATGKSVGARPGGGNAGKNCIDEVYDHSRASQEEDFQSETFQSCVGEHTESASGWMKPAEDELALINSWAYEGERILHGQPSGVDNSVSTYGRMLRFQRGAMTRLRAQPLRVLLTNSQVPRNTRALVQAVRERAMKHPAAMAAAFAAINEISSEAVCLLQQNPEAEEGPVPEIAPAEAGNLTQQDPAVCNGASVPLCPAQGAEETGVAGHGEDANGRIFSHMEVSQRTADGASVEFAAGKESAMRESEKRSCLGRTVDDPNGGNTVHSSLPRLGEEKIEDEEHLLRKTSIAEPAGKEKTLAAEREQSLSTERCGTGTGPQPEEVERRLAELVQMNQGLLDALGVGHPALSAICSITAEHSLQSKLTGAGGGGCVLTLLPAHVSAEEVTELQEQLRRIGCVSFEVAIGGEGVLLRHVRG